MPKKKRYIVVPRTEGVKETGIQTGKGRLTFGDKSAQWVDDPAIAREIDTTHGLKGSGDVWVEQDENLEWHERHDGMTDGKNLGIHRYTFQGVDTSHLKHTHDNGKVWAWVGNVQKRMKREEAIQNGYQIVKQKRRKRASDRREAGGNG